ncbi:MAG: multicopper oxidase family protein, partial [Candidatus Eremiobacteraeota bacterium]|nr:multicopper oxidase family protein [Candidatus Eremiobacteraeota bacterium]
FDPKAWYAYQMSLSRREILIGGAAAAGVAAFAIEGCNSSGGSVLNPAAGQYSYDLTVKYSDHVFGGMTLRTRTYDGMIPGPTLYATPGQPLNISIGNELPPDPPAVAPSGIDPMNNPHLFNTTNLHVHGLQVVPHLFEPVGTSDPNSMMIAISAGQRRLYNFALPPDHPSGLYWYHPHHHGSTDVQVSGGMAGLIIVKGPIDLVPEIAAARDIPIAIQALQVNPDATNPGIFSTEYLAYRSPKDGGYTPRSKYLLMLVNGQLVNVVSGLSAGNPGSIVSTPSAPPVATVQPGEVVRLRILNGTNTLNLPLQLQGFEMFVIGYDGVNFQVPLKIDQTGAGAEAVASANRVEMLVRAPLTPGTYTLSALSTMEMTHAWPKFNLMSFVVSGAPLSMNIPATLPAPSREYPLIADSEIVARRQVVFNSTFPVGSMLNQTALTINGVQYDEMKIMFSPVVGTAEEWTITNQMNEGHPFHIHTNSFEVHRVTSPSGAISYPVPFLADTVWIPANGTVVMRTRFKQWRGKIVFHCHKLPHEDQGMMANVMLS